MSKKHHKKSYKLSALMLLLGLVSNQASAVMYVHLQGLIDLDSPKAPSEPYLIDARLTGNNRLYAGKVYGYLGKWSSEWALVGLGSDGSSYCEDRGSRFVEAIPSAPGKYGFKLDFYRPDGSSSSDLQAWLVLALDYHVKILGPDDAVAQHGLERSYTGTFFKKNPKLRDSMTPDWNICMYPDVYISGGTWDVKKEITFSTGSKMELYTNKELVPGRFKLQKNVSVMTLGPSISPVNANKYERVELLTDVKIVRICKIKNVTQSNFDIVLGRNNEEIRESSFQYTCTADNKPIYISSIAREGRVDSSNKKKLWFDNANGSEASNPPWLLGLPYKDGDNSALSCKDERKSNLLNFNNEDQEIGKNSVSNKAETLNIKWAICGDDKVTPGKYRARVEVAVYTKV